MYLKLKIICIHVLACHAIMGSLLTVFEM